MAAPSTCLVSGALYGPDASPVVGAVVKAYITTGFTDAGGNYLPAGVLGQTTTAADGTWSLPVIQTQGLGHSVTFQFEYTLSNNQSVSKKYSAVIPAAPTATFASLVNISSGTAILTFAPTTDNLPEGATNLYFTNPRASAAAPVQSVNAKTGAVVLSTTDVAEGTNQYFTNARADARITLQKGATSGLATLDSGGKVPVSQLPASLMEYQGTYDASLNSPALHDLTGGLLPAGAQSGWFYRVQVAGTQNFGSGSQTFVVGDWVMYNGAVWQLAHSGADAVQSVNGATGAVVFGHGNLTGLANDDHIQYLLLAGRAGGQTVKGGTAAGDALTLNSTTNATKGKILLGSVATVDESASRFVVGATTGAAGATLDVQGTAGGLGVPVLTGPQRDALAPGRAGLLIWNSDNGRFEYWNGGGWAALSPPATPISITNGGTGQTTQQGAINALTGTQAAGKYLRSDGTNAALAAIVAADVPTLNQNTTGSAASFTGSLAGDVTGTQSATAISASTVTGKAITGFVSGAGTVSATDTILSAINKLDGNIAGKQAADPQLSSLIRQNSQSAAYTTVLTDGGKHIFHPSADATARTFTIDSNANVAYPIGTAITFVNQNGAGVITIAITTDTMRLAGAGTTGSRTLAANGIATALKITSTEWIISGTGLT